MAEALLVTGGQHKSGKAPYLRAVDNVNTDITSPKTKTAVPEELVVACQLVERRAGDGCDGCDGYDGPWAGGTWPGRCGAAERNPSPEVDS